MAVERWHGYDVDAIVTATSLVGKENTFCVLGSTGLAPAGEGARVAGVVIEGAAVGMNSTFQFHNIAKVKLAGTVTMGASVASDAAGLGVAAGAGDLAAGIAREAGVANQLISVILVAHAVPA